MGTIFKALEKSENSFENEHHTVGSLHDKKVSESDSNDKYRIPIENEYKHYEFMVATGLKLLSNETDQPLRVKKVFFPEEYQKKIL